MLQMAVVRSLYRYACFLTQILDSTFKFQSSHVLCAQFRAIPIEFKGKCTELKDSIWTSPKSMHESSIL